MTSLLCAHCLPANLASVAGSSIGYVLRIGPFRTGNRVGARVPSFDLAKEARQMAIFARCPFAKQLQAALILSVTFI
jgi:hypothetical protein